MDALEDTQGYLLEALKTSDLIYNNKDLNPDPDNPSEAIAELEASIINALEKLDNLQK